MTDILPMKARAMKPASGNAPKQLVMLLHGLGANGDNLLDLGRVMSPELPDAMFMAPNAPFACDMVPEGYPDAYQWFSLQNRDREVMFAGAEAVWPSLEAFIEQQLNAFNIAPENFALIGFSQGTMMSLHVALRQENPYGAVVGFSGAFLGMQENENVTAKPPICLVHGMNDDVVPFESMAAAKKQLSEHGVSVKTHERPRLQHSIDMEGIEIATAFLQRHLLK